MAETRPACVECNCNGHCPASTRVFVNYCGSRRSEVSSLIAGAERECRLRRYAPTVAANLAA